MNWTALSAHPALGRRIAAAGRRFGSPLYLYDERTLRRQCAKLMRMPSAFGLTARYAMKANPNRALLNIINESGLALDVSSVNEARRARLAGIPYRQMMLTSQDVPRGEDLDTLCLMLQQGLRYTLCSERQLQNVQHLPGLHQWDFAMRIHHGHGSGASESRDTASPYASFGILVDDLPRIKRTALFSGIKFSCIHGHIGSGSDPKIWKQHLNRMLEIVDRFFPEATAVNLGGGFKVARMPQESETDMKGLGLYAEQQFLQFAQRTGRKLKMEVEPGSFITANAGILLTQILDIKQNPQSGLTFLITDGGMDTNVRPLMYGAQHPFALLENTGRLKWIEGGKDANPSTQTDCVVVGRCCETGDSQTLDGRGRVQPRKMMRPEIGDWLVVGGVGAYSSTLSPFHYNSYLQPPEVLLAQSGDLFEIRKRQTLEQQLANEWPNLEASTTAA